MGRELAGVIACLQEIEIACNLLEKKEGLRGLDKIGPLREMVRRALAAPSVSAAEEVENHILELRAGARDDESDESLVNEPVLVDGVRTSLEGLTQELREVLEDLA